MQLRKLLSLTLGLSALAAASTPALADLRVCNNSGLKTFMALAERDGNTYIARGWWALEPGGGCATLVNGDVDRNDYFIYGYDSDGYEIAGDDRFCVITDRNFSTLDAQRRCTGPGREWRDFLRVDTEGRSDYTFEIYDFNLR